MSNRNPFEFSEEKKIESRDPFKGLTKSSLDDKPNELLNVESWLDKYNIFLFQLGILIGAVIFQLFYWSEVSSSLMLAIYFIVFFVFGIAFWITGSLRKSTAVSVGFLLGKYALFIVTGLLNIFMT